jgi:hypothetical protein
MLPLGEHRKLLVDIVDQCSVISRFMRSLTVLFLITLGLSLPLASRANAEVDVMRLLLSAKSMEELNAAINKAKQSELAPQILTEGKLLFGIRTQDSDFLTSLLPELNTLSATFSPSDSLAGINSVEQIRGMISYVKALHAMEQRDEPAFQQNITDAFWNFPQHGDLFGQAVEKFQLAEKMQRWALDFTIPLLESGGKETTLGKVIGSHKVIVLVFWASNNQASLNALPSAQAIASSLKAHNIPVACVSVDHENAEENAEKVRAELKPTMPWLIESTDRVLTRQIEITSLPRAVIISQQGRVVFHGHPLDADLWRVLKRYAPTIVEPSRK